MTVIAQDTIGLLLDIRMNNNRTWFAEHKDRYQEAHQNVKNFLVDLTSEMGKYDRIEKSKLFRIYRDVRFSKDKSPYHSHWSMSMGRAKPYLRGGYYLKLSPEGATLACGFWNPDSKDLAHIRSNIDLDDQSFRKAIGNKKLQEVFGAMKGEVVKSAPKGYPKDHPAIDLLRHKQFIFTTQIKRAQIHTNGFLKSVVKNFAAIRPFFDYMSDVLSHNLNGEERYAQAGK